MIRRCPHVWQAKGNVCGFAVGNQLNGNQALIVIWCDHDVEFAGVRAVIQAVSRVGTGNEDAVGGTFANRGRENLDVFPPEHSTFTRVRVYRCYCNPLPAELRVGEANQPNIGVLRHLRDRVTQRDVDCCKDHFESGCEERHRILLDAGLLCQEIRLPTKISANGFFVHGRGDNRVNIARQRF